MLSHLVGDVGGTNARLGLVNPGETLPHSVKVLACADYESLGPAIVAYLESIDVDRVADASIAIATPISGDHLTMTNNNWSFSRKELQHAFGLGRLEFINDFAALALAIPHLATDALFQVGQGTPRQGFPAGIIGPGTGLGVAGLCFSRSGEAIALEGEGGHVSVAPHNPRQYELVKLISTQFGHVSAERLLSGPGLIRLYESIMKLDGHTPKALGAADISSAALDQTDPACEEALDIFCAQLGSVAADLALTIGAYGGVYIGGGIVPRLGAYFEQSSFRSSFEAKGRMSEYLSRISTQVIVQKYPALIGAATLLE